MINILIRTHRVNEFRQCIESVKDQLYKNIHLICAVDRPANLQPVTDILNQSKLSHEVIQVENSFQPYHWNFYCNALKEQVKDGWFFYLDDDDILVDRFCLQQISRHLRKSHGTMCQFLRGGKPKPAFSQPFKMRSDHIVKGRVGGSCIFLHHSHKNIANWDGYRAADYRFMAEIIQKLPLHFVPVVVVKALNNGRHGK